MSFRNKASVNNCNFDLMKFSIGLLLVFISIGLTSCGNEVKTVNKDPESKYEMVNGCKKEVSCRLFDKYGKDSLEWVKSYRIDDQQTCDFSSYTIVKKKYIQGKLAEQTRFISGCDECDEQPCGKWKYFDEKGKNIRSEDHGECDPEQFDK